MTLPSHSETKSERGRFHSEQYYKDLLRITYLRLSLTYLLPLLLLVGFFHFQYRNLYHESRKSHLKAIAENQANTLDLFLRERLVNLANVLDDPDFAFNMSQDDMSDFLVHLRQTSEAFVDLSLLDADGEVLLYTGPYPALQTNNYSGQEWFIHLQNQDDNYIITDIYLGFRGVPHFTIAIQREIDDNSVVLRAALSPEEIFQYVTSLEGSDEVPSAIVNENGQYQLLASHIGQPLDMAPFIPPGTSQLGTEIVTQNGKKVLYSYAWLRVTPWVLVVQDSPQAWYLGTYFGLYSTVVVATFAFFIFVFLMIGVLARRSVRRQREVDQHEAELSGQLVQAAKLASVGELAAGIAHEINNPLAIIAEEVGLMKDMMDPEFADQFDDKEIHSHLAIINKAVFRCRDITRKLLGFVRQQEVKLKYFKINDMLNEVTENLLSSELQVSNIEIVRDFQEDMPTIFTDRSQVQQVMVNLLKNASDAMQGNGVLRLKTRFSNKRFTIAVSDTGCGISEEHMQKIFMPFFTTKEIGKGTGLGLSVSLGIIRSLGGQIYLDSELNAGSTFTVELPEKPPD